MALMGTLVESWDNNLANGWSISGPGTPTNNVKLQNNQVEITTSGTINDYFTLTSPTTYDLTSSYAIIKLVSAGSQAANFDCIPLGLAADASNALWFDVNGNNLQAFQKVAGVQTGLGSAVTYSATVHKWLRIREKSGVSYWDFSADGVAWTNLFNKANPITLTTLSAYTQAGQFGASAADTMKTDSFNLPNGYSTSAWFKA